MLSAIRARATGIAAYVVILLISIPFALWGIGEYLNYGEGPEVAEVGGELVSFAAFQEAYQRLRREEERPDGTGVLEWTAELRAQALEELIQNEANWQFLDRVRLRPPDRAVIEEIRGEAAFQTNGAFDPERYAAAMRASRLDPAEYELGRRAELGAEWMTAFLHASAIAGPRQAGEYASLRAETRDLRVWTVSRDGYAEEIEIADDAVEQRYETDLESYRDPARARIAYLELRLEDLEEHAPNDAEIAAHYEAHAYDFRSPELRQVRQIFVREGGAEEAEARAADLHRQLQDGADFAELARAHSEDAASAELGGAIGRLAEEDLPADIAPIVFSLGAGRHSEPLTTERGVYLFLVEAVEAGAVRPLEEVRAQVRAQVAREDRERRYAAAAETLEILAYESPESLEAAAEAIGAEVRTTGRVALDRPGVAVLGRPEVQDALHGAEVREGLNSRRLDLDEGHAVAVRLEEYEPERTRPLDDVRESIRAALADEAALERARAAAAEQLEQLRAGADFAALAGEADSEVRSYAGVTRDGGGAGDLPAAALETAFAMARAEDGAEYGLAETPSGAALIALDAMHRDPDAKPGAGTADRLRLRYLALEVQSLLDGLVAGADVARYPERLE